MTNEHYLVASYCAIGLICVGLAVLSFSLLRPSVAALAAVIFGSRLGRVFRRLLLPGILLPSMAGFFSVTFVSCSDSYDTYQKIIADRSYVVAKNEEQLATSLGYISKALLVWAAAVSVGVLVARRRHDHPR